MGCKNCDDRNYAGVEHVDLQESHGLGRVMMYAVQRWKYAKILYVQMLRNESHFPESSLDGASADMRTPLSPDLDVQCTNILPTGNPLPLHTLRLTTVLHDKNINGFA